MNIISFDIEEWCIENKLHGGRAFKMLQFEEALDKVLQEMSELGIKGTFFCLGKMATDYPEVVKKIASSGHEIGCHSHEHRFLTSLSHAELKSDTYDAISALEDLTGSRVTSYRAPAFSVTPQNAWAVEVLAECGIESDASIFPAPRDFGGYPGFPLDKPCRVSYHGTTLKEYPITTMSFWGRRSAFSGGGFFRIFPYTMVRREMLRRDYNICYFHLADLIPEQKKLMTKNQYEEYFHEPGTIKKRFLRYLKSNVGSGDAHGKLTRLMNEFSFVSIRDTDAQIDWSNTPLVDLSNTTLEGLQTPKG